MSGFKGRPLVAKALWLLLPIWLIQCKKEPSGPTTYHLVVIDEHTGEGLADVPVVLKEFYYPASYHFDTLGYTEASGEFNYVFDREPSSEIQNYRDYYLVGSRGDYYEGQSDQLRQDHVRHEITLGLTKKAILGLRFTRTGADNEVWFSIRNEESLSAVWSGFFNMSLGESRIRYKEVPSNRTTTVTWGPSTVPPHTTATVQSGHGDTTYYSMDF